MKDDLASARITVRVTPRAARDAIDGWTDDGMLLVRVRAAPADGAANDALVRLLAKHLGVSASQVSLVRGARSRLKVIAVADTPDAEVHRLLS